MSTPPQPFLRIVGDEVPTVESQLEAVAERDRTALIELRTQAEMLFDGEEAEYVRPPNIEQIRSFFNALADGVAFARTLIGDRHMPTNLVLWDDAEAQGDPRISYGGKTPDFIVSLRTLFTHAPILFHRDVSKREDRVGNIEQLGDRSNFQLTKIPQLLATIACWNYANKQENFGACTLNEMIIATIRHFKIHGTMTRVDEHRMPLPGGKVSPTGMVRLVQEEPERFNLEA